MTEISIVDRPTLDGGNRYYSLNRAPLQATPLVKLPITAFNAGGWLKRCLVLQRDGLAGHLSEISPWLVKEGNAWVAPDGLGQYGWEEMPYWLRGYARVGYVLRDAAMIEETRFWVDGTIGSQRPNGDFGPVQNHRKGFRDLWGQMLMLQVLQSWYEFCGDERVVPCLTRYFQWQLALPEEQFLKDYWENSRAGDNLASVYWLYNLTGEPFLLELAEKIHRNAANWRQTGHLPNYHNVNIAECFREPATYFQQSGNPADLMASYHVQDFIREKFGQVPGGLFGADENARPGHDDPHQGVETCGMVEQIGSNCQMTAITGDPKWPANSEDVAYNTLPSAFMPDYRALRYLVAPNMATSDAKDHSPGMENAGAYLLMNPFSSRCCQHNHTSGWVNYLESTWMATQDNGLAGLILVEGEVTAKVGDGTEATVRTTTKYPFEETIRLEVDLESPTEFPLYLLIPAWAKGATVRFASERIQAEPGRYVRLFRLWNPGDTLTVRLPMRPSVRVWDQMKGSMSVDFGPLTFSLKIDREYREVEGTSTIQWDCAVRAGADPAQWPSFEILPRSPWNYGLVHKPKFKIFRRPWPKDDYPFTLESVPIEITSFGRKIPGWSLDEYDLVGLLPKSPVEVDTPIEAITLVPMGAAHLRISSFPVVK
ncbi:MAG: glycoside hydrolase family 127 protein [Fimbriimonas sp.]|nr:glycoside hydrolase family 127 protein [Fimbriimonas sp.]